MSTESAHLQIFAGNKAAVTDDMTADGTNLKVPHCFFGRQLLSRFVVIYTRFFDFGGICTDCSALKTGE